MWYIPQPYNNIEPDKLNAQVVKFKIKTILNIDSNTKKNFFSQACTIVQHKNDLAFLQERACFNPLKCEPFTDLQKTLHS